jgi:23S rRNA (uracil-5-)-methyltransferase RumA
MQLKKGQIIEVEIKAVAFGAHGIGDYDGLKVFVADTMPGDKVMASFTRIKKNFAEAKLVEFVSKSADRVEPRCKYSDICGGCQLQYMPYEKQLELKKQHVIDAFERIGKLGNPPVEDVIGCDENFYYRNKMEFSFGYDADMKFTLGMHLPGRRYDILDLEECYLQSEFSVAILNKVREFAIEKDWKPYQYSTGEGLLRSLFIREGKRTGEFMVNISSSGHEPDSWKEDLEEFVDMLLGLDCGENKLVSIYWSKIISKRGMPKQIREHLLYGKKSLTEKMLIESGLCQKDELNFEIFPQSFFQVNTLQGEILYSEILKKVLDSSHNMVFDLFCGTGTIGLFLAKHVEHVIGVELNSDSIKAARENATKNNIFNIDFHLGDVGKMLSELRERPSLIVVDPPRPGLPPKSIKIINDFGPKQIVYVSCNPSTLARDCQLLSEYGYKVKSVQPVDMFPHTYHIENVCLLER